jgi:hypothetical protein
MISRSGVKYYERVPTWRNGNWEVTEFGNREEFKSFVLDRFKEPGQYGFNEDTAIFNEQATIFNERNYFCQAPIKSKDFVNYWDDQKVKNRNGIIVISGDKTWYVCRDYYMWLNFLPIYDKEESLFGFAKVRDAQYHMALYELLAELHYKHSAILKKRQIASSYFHSAKLINQVWFEEGVTLKMGASLKDYINEKGTWKMLDEYAQIQVDSLEKVAGNCQDLIVINKKLQTTLGVKDSLINKKDSVYTQIISTKEENITKLERKIKKRTAIGSVIGGLLVVLIIIFGVS